MAYKARDIRLFADDHSTGMEYATRSFLDDTWLPKHAMPNGFRLHHYTDLAGMRGILESRALWCSHVTTFNDPSEIRYGEKIVKDVLREFMEQKDEKNVRTFMGYLMDNIGFLTGHTPTKEPFVACFCESENLLSQWRGYADRGSGYCLGFDFSSGNVKISASDENLRPVITGNSENEWEPHFRRVVYDEAEQRGLVRQYIERIVVRTSDTHPANLRPMAYQAVNVLCDMLICFKHPAFEEEHEWRLVRLAGIQDQPENLRFREVGGCLVPYRPTHIYSPSGKGLRFPLWSIHFGPKLDPRRTKPAIRLLLQHIEAGGHPIAVDGPPIDRPRVKVEGAGFEIR